MSQIEQLTSEQLARFAEFRDKWVAIGLSTEPADRKRAEKAIRLSYQYAGLPGPKKIIWCGSPLSQELTRAITKNKTLWASVGASVRASVRASVWASVGDSVEASVWASVGASIGASVWDSVGDSVGDSVEASVRDSVWDSVRASVRDSVWDSVWDSIWASVRASVRDSVWASVWDSVWASVRASVWASVRDSVEASVGDSVGADGYGQHDASWLSFYEYFRDVCGLTKETDKLIWLLEQAKSAGWYLLYQHICWVSERYHILQRDESGRLHCLTGPAVMYPDGWAIYAVHGVRVPEHVIEHPRDITIREIEAERNAEVHRVMVERYGEGRYLEDSGARVVHADKYGTLYRKEIPGDEPLVMVKVVNSTPEPDGSLRRFFLRVPPDMTKAREAVAWTFGLKEEEYALNKET